MPETEALLPRFRAAHTQVLGVSVDSVYSHANWAVSLGGISFPLLADFEPKGGLARSLGLYLDGPGITDRATVIIDSSGVVRFASAVGPGGRRDIAELVAECEKLDRESSGPVEDFAEPKGVPEGAVLYVKSRCGFSRAAELARSNRPLGERLALKNVSDDAAALSELQGVAGSDQAPCLVVGGKATQESEEIIGQIVGAIAPI